MPKGVGGDRARDANLKLFHAVFPDQSAVERAEDKATNQAERHNWIRPRNQLEEGRTWLELRDLVGRDGAFLVLPPQCGPGTMDRGMPPNTLVRCLIPLMWHGQPWTMVRGGPWTL